MLQTSDIPVIITSTLFRSGAKRRGSADAAVYPTKADHHVVGGYSQFLV